MQAVAHVWQGGGWAMRLSCEAALRHHEHNAAVLRPLLHAPQLVLCLESSAQVPCDLHCVESPAEHLHDACKTCHS